MKVLHLIAGGDRGGAKTHVVSLLGELNKAEETPLLCLGEGALYEAARAAKLPVRSVSGRFAAGLRSVRAALEAEKIEALHCHGARANLTGALLKKSSGLPVLSTVHSDHTLDYLGRPLAGAVYGSLNAWALGRMDALVCVSDAMAETYRARGFRRVYPIYNGVDFSAPLPPVDRREILARCGIPFELGAVYVGTAARFEPVKDLPILLRGFARAAGQEGRLRLVLAGSGSQEGRLRAMAEELGVAGRVFFPGWVEDAEALLAAMDAAALTSRSETFPYVLTSAARRGVPVVSTPVGGVPALVEDGINGFLVPVGDDEALAKALLTLGGDAALRASLGAALREKAERRFSLAAMAERQREIYGDILNTSIRC